MTAVPHPVIFTTDPLPADIGDPRRELGGKGMSLRELSAAGCRVPRGFTIRAGVGRRAVTAGRTIPEDVWDAVVTGIERLERETGRSYGGPGDSRLLLAVRSGAAESMPGLLQTSLRVGAGEGKTDKRWGELRQAIGDVFASWDRPAACAYRQAQGIEHSLGTAVTVQEHIDCRIAGVLFTRAPDREASDVMTLEAVIGSGEALVSGRSTPLHWHIHRDDLSIVEDPEEGNRSANDQDAIDKLRERLSDLGETALHLEHRFGRPLDIEWGLDTHGLVYFQARPITTTADRAYEQEFREREIERLRHLAQSGSRMWVRHNLNETLTHPTPLTWSLWKPYMSGRGGLGTLYRRLGYSPCRQTDGFLTLIGGQIYAEPDRAVTLFGKACPCRFDEDELRRDPVALNRPPTSFDPTRCDPWLLWKLPLIAWQSLRMRRRFSTLMTSAAERFDTVAVPAFRIRLSELHTFAPGGMDNAQLSEQLEACRELVFDDFGPESLLPGMLGAMAYHTLIDQLSPIFGDRDAAQIAREVTPTGDRELHDRQQALLASAASSGGEPETFLTEFGHRAIGEMELAVPRWRETPDVLQKITSGPGHLRKQANGGAGMPHSLSEAREDLKRRFREAGAQSLFSGPAATLHHCWLLFPYRDRGKHEFLKGYERLRQLLEEAGNRTGLAGNVYFLTFSEVLAALRGTGASDVFSQRRADWQAVRGWRLPDVITIEELDALRADDIVPGTVEAQLQGTGLVSGRATGVVVTLESLVTAGSPEVDSVLVCGALEPALAPLLESTSAVVVEQGGTLSHGAILARQFGIPVVRLADATVRLDAGRRINVDGNTGRIEFVNDAVG